MSKNFSADDFVLFVNGNGMKNAGISDSDLIRCKRTDKASDREIVYAMVGSERTTLSRYREVRGEIRLYSETDDVNFAPYIRIDPKRLTILGVFQKVIRWI